MFTFIKTFTEEVFYPWTRTAVQMEDENLFLFQYWKGNTDFWWGEVFSQQWIKGKPVLDSLKSLYGVFFPA